MIRAMENKPQSPKSRDTEKYIVRFPDGMREQLKTAAADNNRSLNSEIIERLQQSLEPTISDTENQRRDQLALGFELRIAALVQQITILKSVLRNAAGIIRAALISGRTGKIPDHDAKWMAEEANHFSKIASEDNFNIKGEDQS